MAFLPHSQARLIPPQDPGGSLWLGIKSCGRGEISRVPGRREEGGGGRLGPRQQAGSGQWAGLCPDMSNGKTSQPGAARILKLQTRAVGLYL